MRALFYLLALLTLTETALALGLYDGERVHDGQCLRCHNESIYTRKDRAIKDYQALGAQVVQCGLAAEANWFDDEIEAVTDYLNTHFYQFEF